MHVLSGSWLKLIIYVVWLSTVFYTVLLCVSLSLYPWKFHRKQGISVQKIVLPGYQLPPWLFWGQKLKTMEIVFSLSPQEILLLCHLTPGFFTCSFFNLQQGIRCPQHSTPLHPMSLSLFSFFSGIALIIRCRMRSLNDNFQKENYPFLYKEMAMTLIFFLQVSSKTELKQLATQLGTIFLSCYQNAYNQGR